VPERPGVISSRTLQRGDTRIARWNRPVDRGSVRVRHGEGAPVAWEGRGGRTSVTSTSRGARTPGERRGFAAPSGSGGRDGGAAVRAPVTRSRTPGTSPSRSGNRGVRAPAFPRDGGERSFSRGGVRMSGNPGVRTVPGRSLVGRVPAGQTGDGFRGIVNGRSQRNTSVGSRGFDRGFRSPASSVRGGGGGVRGGGGGGGGRGGGGGGFRGSR
jgi:translation initiation factor IF-2